MSVLITKDSPLINECIVPDEVIGIAERRRRGRPGRHERLVRPDILRGAGMRPSDSSSKIGLPMFMWAATPTFIDNGRTWCTGSRPMEGTRYNISYSLGTWSDRGLPRTGGELDIEDVFQQYKALAEMLKGSRQHQGRPSRGTTARSGRPSRSLPSKRLTEMFDSSVLFVGNPCQLEI